MSRTGGGNIQMVHCVHFVQICFVDASELLDALDGSDTRDQVEGLVRG
jgi:hypothetical protein